MSYMDLEGTNGFDLISQFVASCRNQSAVLPYNDYQVIRRWLTMLPDTDQLLVILADILPKFYADHAEKTRPPSLKKISGKIEKKIANALIL